VEKGKEEREEVEGALGRGLTFLADPKCDSHSLAPDRTSFSVHVSLSPSSYRMEYLFEVNLETFPA